MKTKTAELAGIGLDWAVAHCEGGDNLSFDGIAWMFQLEGALKVLANGWARNMMYLPSSDWACGGPIIEREGVHISPTLSHDEVPPGVFHLNPTGWQAQMDYSVLLMAYRYSCTGPTPLIAAMRCYVACAIGDSVELPDLMVAAV